mmetsp:Transcript_129708/g.375669  ORF Transcript_129708/g.375669 Transcript_129708/m.375669 type:complete len:208 (-) Transcript_129708:17-640(-)
MVSRSPMSATNLSAANFNNRAASWLVDTSFRCNLPSKSLSAAAHAASTNITPMTKPHVGFAVALTISACREDKTHRYSEGPAGAATVCLISTLAAVWSAAAARRRRSTDKTAASAVPTRSKGKAQMRGRQDAGAATTSKSRPPRGAATCSYAPLPSVTYFQVASASSASSSTSGMEPPAQPPHAKHDIATTARRGAAGACAPPHRRR